MASIALLAPFFSGIAAPIPVVVRLDFLSFILPKVDAVAATRDGALIATEDGHIYRYHAHHDLLDSSMGSPYIEITEQLGRISSIPFKGGLMAVGEDVGVVFINDEGHIGATLPREAVADHLSGAALASLPDNEAILILGGAPEPGGEPTTTTTRVELLELENDALELIATTLDARLTRVRKEFQAVVLEIQIRGDDCPFVVAVGGYDRQGGSLTEIEAIDPSDHYSAVMLDAGASLELTALAPSPPEIYSSLEESARTVFHGTLWT